MEKEHDNKLFFLDVLITHADQKFKSSIYLELYNIEAEGFFFYPAVRRKINRNLFKNNVGNGLNFSTHLN